MDQGHGSEIHTEAGGEVGSSGASTRDRLFPDGSECEEWAFYRGECAPGTPGRLRVRRTVCQGLSVLRLVDRA